uniref:Pancreatic trypsin inhibitor n=1 Tax=Rhipicephalus appendiculatus TaxID=34631 RepID=A0A131YQ07_RHIAP
MHTLTLVVILILSNIVPPAIAKFNFWDLFRWNRRTTTAPPNRWQIKNHTYIKPSCSGGNGSLLRCPYPQSTTFSCLKHSSRGYKKEKKCNHLCFADTNETA